MAAVFAIVVFNRLVKQRNLVADAWAGIDVQLTRRADLVPNLVEVVKGYRLHEARDARAGGGGAIASPGRRGAG